MRMCHPLLHSSCPATYDLWLSSDSSGKSPQWWTLCAPCEPAHCHSASTDTEGYWPQLPAGAVWFWTLSVCGMYRKMC